MEIVAIVTKKSFLFSISKSFCLFNNNNLFAIFGNKRVVVVMFILFLFSAKWVVATNHVCYLLFVVKKKFSANFVCLFDPVFGCKKRARELFD